MGSFPKIFHIGNRNVLDIFENDVEITEKVDGSQFGFGLIDNELHMHTGSGGNKIYLEKHDKMFNIAVAYVAGLLAKDKLINNYYYYAEYLEKPCHNVLCYDRVPRNNIVLFGVRDLQFDKFLEYEYIKHFANLLDIDVVPILFKGKLDDKEELLKLLDTMSFLGGSKIEGIVIKNYEKQLLIGGHHIPILSAKFVSESFKELHDTNWKKEHTGKGRFELYKERFRSKARWMKAVQHLRDKGELEEDPRDIGKLLKEINLDLIEECQDEIKEWLWKEFGKDIIRNSTKGFPEWYKNYLLEKGLNNIKKIDRTDLGDKALVGINKKILDSITEKKESDSQKESDLQKEAEYILNYLMDIVNGKKN